MKVCLRFISKSLNITLVKIVVDYIIIITIVKLLKDYNSSNVTLANTKRKTIVQLCTTITTPIQLNATLSLELSMVLWQICLVVDLTNYVVVV